MLTIDPVKVDDMKPFDEPGLYKVQGEEWDYELIFTAEVFQYNPGKIEVPLGATGFFGWFKKLPWGDARFIVPFIGMVNTSN